MLDNPSAALRDARREASPWIKRLARFGYAAKGVVYLLVGALAVQAALEHRAATDSSGALQWLLEAPLGRALLGLMAVGLFGYAIWRFFCAATDPEHEGALARVYFAITALLHTGLGLEAARLALGNGGGGGDSTGHWSARVLAQPFGGLILGVIGAIIGGFGIAQLVRAWRAKLDERLDLSRVGGGTRRAVVLISRIGLAARGLVFLLIGSFVVRAALSFDPGQARGVDGALNSLQRQPYGAWLLGGVALGLIAYGSYELLRARYRRIHTGDPGEGERGRTYIRVERA